MTTQRKVELAGAILLVALLALFLRGWQLEREARIRAQASADSDEKLVHDRDQAIKDRDTLAAQYTAALQRQAAAIQTPQQAAQVILHYLPQPASQAAPAAIPQVERTQLSPEVQKALPDAPSFSLLTPTQIEQLAKDEIACDATRKNLTTCQDDAMDLRMQISLKADEAAKWESTAKGGTKWQRFGHVSKLVLCGGAGAGLGALVAQKNPAIGASIGASAGVTGCSLF